MKPLRFQSVVISDERYESCAVFDVDNDGFPDIVSGAYWYPGPSFDRKCRIGAVRQEGEYFDDFSTIPLDINGDGYLDFVTGGWWGKTLVWKENPKGDREKQWQEHPIAEVGSIETTRAWDIDGDGVLEIVPNTPSGPVRVFKLITDENGRGTGRFTQSVIFEGPSGHGLGCGDINGDGRNEIVLSSGWLQPPEEPLGGRPWTLHREFDLGVASVPIIVADVNGDGLPDLISGSAHGYGLDWWEQTIAHGRRRWVRHPIDPCASQYHDLWWGDIDGDGASELVTGKRYRAHCGKDPGEYDPYGISYFKWHGEGFAKIPIIYGDIRQTKGCGISFAVADIDGDGRPDIAAPGKDGLYLFRNLGPAPDRGA